MRVLISRYDNHDFHSLRGDYDTCIDPLVEVDGYVPVGGMCPHTN